MRSNISHCSSLLMVILISSVSTLVHAATTPLPHREVVVCSENAFLLAALQQAGVSYSVETDLNIALRADKPRIAIIDATPQHLLQLTQDAALLKNFFAAQGWLMLQGLTPEGLASFNTLVGVEHLLRPVRDEKVCVPAEASPLANSINHSGFSARDLLTPGLFSAAVDTDDVAPFATLPSADVFGYTDTANDHNPINMVNGFTSHGELAYISNGWDSWKNALTIPLTAGKTPAFTLTLPKVMPVNSFDWIGNTSFHRVTKVELSFDDHTSLELGIQPNGELQHFPITPPRMTQAVNVRLSAWDNHGDRELTGIDNLYLHVQRPATFAQTVSPLLNIGTLVAYPRNAGGILLCNLAFDARTDEQLPAKRMAILTTLLRNLRATFVPMHVEEGWFAFNPEPDPFLDSPLDLRYLNEKSAGEHGFIQAKGRQFVSSRNEQPVRFWGVNIGHTLLGMSKPELDRLARHLAKYGVNAVRVYAPDASGDGVDAAQFDTFCYMVFAMKRQGIYVWLGNWNFGLGRDDLYNAARREVVKRRYHALLTTVNPYTGVPLIAEPALASLQIQAYNSGLFDWPFQLYNNMQLTDVLDVEKQFGDWLAHKYGSLDKAFAVWNASGVTLPTTSRYGLKVPNEDDAAAGTAGLRAVLNYSLASAPRFQDTVNFLTQCESTAIEDVAKYVRNDLHFSGIIAGSHTWPGDASPLAPWYYSSHLGLDCLGDDSTRVTTGEWHPDREWCAPGAQCEENSLLTFSGYGMPGWGNSMPGYPFIPPIRQNFYNNKPSIFESIGWGAPRCYLADMPLVCAAYGALQGTNAIFFQHIYSADWEMYDDKFQLHTPVGMGQFPAAALIYRQSDVRPGDTVVDGVIAQADMTAGKSLPEPKPYQAEQFTGIASGSYVTTPAFSLLDPLAYLCGRVQVAISAKGGSSRAMNINKLIDRTTGAVSSSTGELQWKYRDGLVTVNSPLAQGVTGVLAQAGAVTLGDVTISSQLDYGAILLVSLDGKPLASSRKMLLQVMSEDKNHGWGETVLADHGTSRSVKLTDMGGAPVIVRNLVGSVTFTRADAKSLKITALDLNGYLNGSAVAGPNVQLQPDTLYYYITR